MTSSTPLVRWDVDAINVRGFNSDQKQRLRYAAFLVSGVVFDAGFFRTRPAEAAAMDP